MRKSLSEAMNDIGVPMPETGLNPHRFTRWGRRDRYWAVRKGSGYCFGDLATGQKGAWFPPDSNGTGLHFDYEAERCKREERQRKVADQCKALWSSLPSADSGHGYLATKGIAAYGIKQEGNQLVIPLRDSLMSLWSVQRIDPAGDKRLLAGGRKQGCFHVVGSKADTKKPLLFAEGYATAASLHMVTGLAVVMTVDAGNLFSVVKNVRRVRRNQPFVIAADNDQWGLINIGKTKAEEAAKLFNCRIVLPEFASSTIAQAKADDKSLPTDWNDLHLLEGADRIQHQLSNLIS